MSIISFEYLIFVCLFFGIFSFLKNKSKKYLILIFSYLFYGSISPILLSALILSTLFNYFGNKIFLKNEIRWIIVSNISLLLVFKLNINLGTETVLVPIGISFFTFQAIGYVIDRSRNQITFSHSFIDFANYLAFFPQLISGPIEKFNSLGGQLAKSVKLSFKNIQEGLFLILIGLCKKLIIADRCGVIVDSVYDHIHLSNGTSIVIATVLFYFQIFLDFSGFCNIAEGISKLIGINLSPNFNKPYLSSSISEYWRKWHISLHKWFKEYLYSGLKTKMGWCFAAFLTFLISGLWHGINITFLIWGIYCFLCLIFDKYIIQKYIKYNFLRVISVALLIISSRIFYRSNSLEDLSILFSKSTNWESLTPVLSDLFYILSNPFTSNFSGDFNIGMQKIEISHFDLIIMFSGLLFWGIITVVSMKINQKNTSKNLAIFCLSIILMVLGFNNDKPFIYLQF